MCGKNWESFTGSNSSHNKVKNASVWEFIFKIKSQEFDTGDSKSILSSLLMLIALNKFERTWC